MKKNMLFLLFLLTFISCENGNPAFKFSNFYGTPADNIARAIKNNNIKEIRKEVLSKQIDVNFEDEIYEVSLLELAITNNKKESFEELLRLGANPNIDNSSCVSPLISAIRYNFDCDLYFVKRLLDNNAEINPKLFKKCNSFTHDPVCETILHYNDEDKIECGLEILKILTAKMDNPEVLFLYNNPEDYQENIIYNCLSSSKNLNALKYLIVDLNYKVPEKIFIDGTVLLDYNGYKALHDILESDEFLSGESDKFIEIAKNDILNYLKK